MKYASGDAFRKALSDTLRRRHPNTDLDGLLKRVAMERYLARVEATLGEQALLKGGYALELRLARARTTRDLDLALVGIAAGDALEALRDAGEADLDDHLRYRLERNRRGTPQGAPATPAEIVIVTRSGRRPCR